MNAVGFKLLQKLGLSEEEANKFIEKKQKPTNNLYARDQKGIDFKESKANYVMAADLAFANLNQKLAGKIGIKNTTENKLESTPQSQRFFIPNKLRKRNMNSLSTDDLACILSTEEPTNNVNQPIELITPEPEIRKHRRRRHHHHHEEAQETA